jgi:hypothetical protein
MTPVRAPVSRAGCSSPGGWLSGGRSVEAEPAPADVVEVVGLETVGPASAVAKILVLSMDAIEQIQRSSEAGLQWWREQEWMRLRSGQWPIVRDLLLQ